MLYLVVTPEGKPEHLWSIEPEKDFAGMTVKGPALLDEHGLPADSAILSVNGDQVFIDPAKKLAREQERLAKKQAVEDLRNANSELRILARKADLTAIEMKRAVELLLKIQFGG